MKVGILADLHSNLEALEAVVRRLGDVEEVLCAGDLVGYGAQPNEVVELVRREQVFSIQGDHDRFLFKGLKGFGPTAAKVLRWTKRNLKRENLEYLKQLPSELDLKLQGVKIHVVHGEPSKPFSGGVFPSTSGRELLELVQKVKADVLVLGHTHLPFCRRVQGKLVINPGSVGQPRDRDPRASYAVLKLGKRIELKFERVRYDVERVAREIVSAGLPPELGDRLRFGW